jgi:hypothetical protein
MSLDHKQRKESRRNAGEPIKRTMCGLDCSVSYPGDPFEDQILSEGSSRWWRRNGREHELEWMVASRSNTQSARVDDSVSLLSGVHHSKRAAITSTPACKVSWPW